jgi:arsenate reductase
MTPNRPTVLFVCLHGGAKSLIAAEYFNRLARARGLGFDAECAGMDPYVAVPAPVVAGLAREGFDVQQYLPRRLEPDAVAQAAHVVSFGCELPSASSDAHVERWDDVPMVSDGFDEARDAIVARLSQLVDSLARSTTTNS